MLELLVFCGSQAGGHQQHFWKFEVVCAVDHAEQGPGGRRLRFVNNMRLALDLRKTLWWWKLANVLVFERQEHAEALRQKLRRKDKTVLRLLNRLCVSGF